MNSWLRFAPKGAVGLALALVCVGCHKAEPTADDWVKEIQQDIRDGKLEEADVALTQAQALAGEDTDVRILSAQMAWYNHDYASAKQLFHDLATDASLDATIRSRGWVGEGIVEMAEKQRDKARVDFLKAIRTDNREASAWYHLGCLYRDDFEYPEAALDAFSVYMHLDNIGSERVQTVQVKVLPSLKNRMAEAAKARQGRGKRDPATALKALEKAEAAWKKGGAKDLKLARQEYQAALTADPLSFAAAQGLAKAWEATDKSHAGQQKALDNYRLACALKTSSRAAYLKAGQFATSMGSYQQAIDSFSRALTVDPQSVDAIDGLIKTLRKAGRNEDAAAYQDYRNFLAATRRK